MNQPATFIENARVVKIRETFADNYYDQIIETLKLISTIKDAELKKFYHLKVLILRMIKKISFGFEQLYEKEQNYIRTKYKELYMDYLDKSIILASVYDENHYLIKVKEIHMDYETFNYVLFAKKTVYDGFLTICRLTNQKKLDAIMASPIKTPQYILNY